MGRTRVDTRGWSVSERDEDPVVRSQFGLRCEAPEGPATAELDRVFERREVVNVVASEERELPAEVRRGQGLFSEFILRIDAHPSIVSPRGGWRRSVGRL